ncbi:MAG: flavodoxin domain-containing protein [Sedimentibacter saalensis]|uniref:flavodoxin domain-containing protein n=1 Tax=Sedimentibacter saalensis TaxID=130788 RepID=UPI002B21831F|nr:flavodoxin domain-containing protein [Sedimentibacter saalensis]MEA5094298.1 flavodoxin domain-containing protein [Sedimentibacter saalensis]
MKTLIVYYSAYRKNTEKIAECMAGQFNGDLVHAKDYNENDVNNYDLVGFGSGVYNQKMHPSIFKAIEKSNLQNKNTFVFSTSAVGIKKYNNDAIKLLLDKNAKVVGSFSCRGFFTTKILDIFGGTAKGHPNNVDFQNAEKFAEKIMKEIN